MAEVTIKPETPVEVTTPPPPPPPAVEVMVPEAEKESLPAPAEEEPEPESKKIDSQLSFKEETNDVNELPESQRKALEEFKKLIQEALQKHELSSDPLPPPPPPAKEEEKKETPKTEDIPKIEETPKTEETPKIEETPKTEETPKPKETPKTEETPKIEETPKTEEAPKPKETLKIEETPKTEEAPKQKETLKIEETPKTEEAPKQKETLKIEETPKTEEAPKTITIEEEKTVEAIKETIVEVVVEPEEVSIWGIPLLADERSDVILLKFLRARDFKVKEAFAMLKSTVRWRKEIGVDALLDEDLGNDYEKVVFTHGHDKQGRPVCYNVFGEFQNKELYQNTFSDAEKRKKFLTWLIQFLEKTIRTLDFSPKGINSFVLINDLKNSPGGYGKRDLHKVVDKFLEILQDNYPEFVFKQVCTNVSWWYLAYNWIFVTVISPRSKSKFVFASPSKTPDTLFKYISPEQVPIQYGGHSKEGDHEFSSSDCLTEVTIKPGSKHSIEFPLTQAPAELVWELRVIGWEVNYGAEYLPEKEGAYTLNIAKPKKLTATDEPLLCDSFKATETGKVVITIDNQTSKKKKLLYRSKIKASSV